MFNNLLYSPPRLSCVEFIVQEMFETDISLQTGFAEKQ